MAHSTVRIAKFICQVVLFSWLSCQVLLVYHLKYGPTDNPKSHITKEVPLSLKNARQGLIDAVSGLYSLEYSEEKMKYYDENAVAEDPVVRLDGKVSLASGFGFMEFLFRRSESLKVNVLHGKHLIVLDQVRRYTTTLGSFTLDFASVDYLYLKGEPGKEKIIRHVVEMNGKHLLGPEAPYFANVGLVAAKFRQLHGWPIKYIFSPPRSA
eukprot:gene152-765_t